MKKKILILGGGISKERQISLETAKQVKKALKKKYRVLQSDLDINFENKIKFFKPEVVFNALHGRFGEDGVCGCAAGSAAAETVLCRSGSTVSSGGGSMPIRGVPSTSSALASAWNAAASMSVFSSSTVKPVPPL